MISVTLASGVCAQKPALMCLQQVGRVERSVFRHARDLRNSLCTQVSQTDASVHERSSHRGYSSRAGSRAQGYRSEYPSSSALPR